jgi:hypothetical protein
MSPELNTGVWLEHEAFHEYHSCARRAEINDVRIHEVGLYLEGEPGLITIGKADILRWWNPFVPVGEEECPPPGIFVESAEFRLGNFYATIRTMRRGWISYLEDSPEFKDVLRIVPYHKFRRMGWTRLHKLSRWEWLRTPMV